MVKELERMIEMYDLAIVALNLQKEQNMIGNLKIYH